MSLRGMGESSSSFIEDFVEQLGALPNDIRRHFELMRSLDKEGTAVLKDLEESERRLLADLKKRGRGAQSRDPRDTAALEEIAAKRTKARQMVEEKVQIAEQAVADCDAHVERCDKELSAFEEHLRTSGEFAATGYAIPGDQVAVKQDDDWILARVKEYDMTRGIYTVMDEDDASKSYDAPETLTMVLDNGDKITKGEDVFAVYPDTTSFYPATVTMVPRRSTAAGGGNNAALNCTVQFVDDHDETGVTPDRYVPLRYVFKRAENEES